MNIDNYNIWYIRIMELKEKHNYSLNDLVHGIGVTDHTIANWKSSDIKSKNLVSVSKFFDVSSDYILGLSNEPTLSNRNPEMTEKQAGLIRFVEALKLSESQFSKLFQIIYNIMIF